MNYEFASDHPAENSVGITGMLFVLSGKPETFFNRKDFINFIQRKGAKVTDILSPEVDYLITNDAGDSKKKKATELGVKIITERQFNEIADRVFDVTGKGTLMKYFGAGGIVTLPDTVTAIGDLVFLNCASLEKINLPQELTTIGDAAFSGCTSLAKIDFPPKLTAIGNQTFSGCTALRTITLPKGLTSIGSLVFEKCENIEIRIPAGLEKLSEQAYLFDFVDRSYKAILFCEDISLLAAALRKNAAIGFSEDGGEGSELRRSSHLKYMKANAAKLVDTAMAYPKLLNLMLRKS